MELSNLTVIMFDMFDNSNRGWLIKLIEEVEGDMVEEEEVAVGAAIVAAIVESEFVEIVFCSDTMKKFYWDWIEANTSVITRRKNQRIEKGI